LQARRKLYLSGKQRWIGRSAGDWIELGRNEIGDEAGLSIQDGRRIESGRKESRK
jgi:hypothetical protein